MKKLLLLFIGLIFYNGLFSQIKATTENGKDVILNSDGTWEYKIIESEKKQNLSSDNVDLSCDNLIENVTDKMTGDRTISIKENIVVSKDGKNGFGLFAMKSKKLIILSIVAVGAGSCIDDDAKINILFRDGTKAELINNSDFNCKGKVTLYFGGAFGKKKELITLKNKEIETLRIWTNNGYVQEDFSKENSQKLKAAIDCLMER